jgi:hypothetical protein
LAAAADEEEEEAGSGDIEDIDDNDDVMNFNSCYYDTDDSGLWVLVGCCQVHNSGCQLPIANCQCLIVFVRSTHVQYHE